MTATRAREHPGAAHEAGLERELLGVPQGAVVLGLGDLGVALQFVLLGLLLGHEARLLAEARLPQVGGAVAVHGAGRLRLGHRLHAVDLAAGGGDHLTHRADLGVELLQHRRKLGVGPFLLF